MIFYVLAFIFATVATAVWLVPKWQISHLDVNEKDKLVLENELRKTIAQIFGGLAILIGLYFTSEQLVATRKSLEIAQEGQTTERFTRAVEQLGSQQLQVRVGGTYGLGEIAKTSPRDRSWLVLSILAAFVRERARWQGPAPVRALPEDIQAALSVITSRDTEYFANQTDNERTIDLEDTDLRRAYLVSANLEGTHLARARLEGADLRHAHLKSANLVGTHLEDASLEDCDLSGADLRDAQMSGANVSGARLFEAHFEGVNLSSVIGLSEPQMQSIIKDAETIVPNSTKRGGRSEPK